MLNYSIEQQDNRIIIEIVDETGQELYKAIKAADKLMEVLEAVLKAASQIDPEKPWAHYSILEKMGLA